MTARTFIYGRLTTFPGLLQLIGTSSDPSTARVFSKKTMTSAREDHPYIVYKLGYNASENLSEDLDTKNPERQFLQIYVHDYMDVDGNADYMRIDQIIAQLKLALRGQVSPEDGIMGIEYLETSQDLDDDTLNTVMKYARFQMTLEGVNNG